MTEYANESERREAALEAMRGAPPPQGSAGGDAHDSARPDAEALALYAEANDLPEYGGVINPRYLERMRERARPVETVDTPSAPPFGREPGGPA